MTSRLTKEVDAKQKAQLPGCTPKTVRQIKSLADKAESEIARLKANADVLDRAGRQSVVKKEIRETSDIENMSDPELQKELDALLVSQGYIKW